MATLAYSETFVVVFVVVQRKYLCLINFYDNRDNNDNVLLTTSTVLSVDNNKNNFYQPKGWLPLETC